MNSFPPRQDRRSLMIVALVAFLVSLPFSVSAVYDWIRPQSVVIGDSFTSTYEQFKIERYEKMSDEDMQRSGLDKSSNPESATWRPPRPKSTEPIDFTDVAKPKASPAKTPDESEMRKAYDAIAASHWNAVTEQTRRHLLMYCSLSLVSLGYFLFALRAFRRNEHCSLKETEYSKPSQKRGHHDGPRGGMN